MLRRNEFASDGSRATPWARLRGRKLLIGCLALLCAYSALRGVSGGLAPAGAAYFVVDYSNGFIRRGLIGEIFMAVYSRAAARDAWQAAWWMHQLGIGVLVAGLLAWAATARDTLGGGRLAAILVVFAAAQFLPTLTATAGYLDIYVLLLALACFALASHGQVWLAALLGCVGPVIHEMFLFYWLALVLMLVFRDGSELLRRRDNILVACALPVLAVALVLLFSDKAAVAEQLARAPLSPAWRATMRDWQFGNTFAASLGRMGALYAAYPGRFVVSLVLFGFPTLVMLRLAWPGLAGTRRAVLVVASLVPLLMLAIAWDLSRIVVATQFCCVMCVLFAAGALPARARGVALTRTEAWICMLLAAFMLPLPLFYGYFDRTFAVRNAVLEAVPVVGPWLHALLLPYSGA